MVPMPKWSLNLERNTYVQQLLVTEEEVRKTEMWWRIAVTVDTLGFTTLPSMVGSDEQAEQS